ncbi:DUF885 domain-containing protein [Alteriqipengyuania lutimaris]|uniref:DUF885 domain-containing protein n=1 Tax=Alteriqipengyuania lutimaris TaxID=1538146 RepID=A0A395LKT7_9SPHN|nr:DUF885 domain-containing protein [Alteriqipengyuania lutimaris]MBB3033317.1 uncharacterized protein (DUF885 family) [Alteriqipengyuania lutimaris]RDS77646.1 DUF885 domain-containing protein [Alteriqipengyuania lutimaris]
MNTFSLTRRQTLAGLAASTALTLGGCSTTGTAPRLRAMTTAPDEWLDQVAYGMLQYEPERATSLGVDTGEYAGLRGKLEDQSPAGQREYAAYLRWVVNQMDGLDESGLTPDQQTSYQVVRSAFSNAVEGFDLPYGDVAVGSWRNAPYVVIQNVGTYLDMPRFLDSSQPLSDEADVGYYLDRLKSVDSALDGELERLEKARALGVIPPDFLLDKAIAAMEASVASAPQDYVKPLEKAPEGARDAAMATARMVVDAEIVPALQRQLAELKAERARANLNAGMWAQPGGPEWYAWALKASTTTTMSPDEIHEQGLEELDALHARMDPILRDIGYDSGTVGERMQALSTDKRYQFAEGDPGRKQIMDFIHDRIDWITAQMPRAFNELVDPNVEVRRLPLAEEPGAPGAYGGAGSKDGSIPARMWINLRTTDLHRKYDLADLTYHESVPGHAWEGTFSNRLPLIRSILAFNAFSEGWALYAEQLADELGAYDDFQVGRLGYLQSLAFRACRLVVDTGLHHKRWTREQGRQFFVERNGSKAEEVASEVDRYCSWPGQACGYKIGHSQIVAQRERAKRAMGGAYDFKGFNTAVILGGNSPLDVLDKTVSRYISNA